MTKYHNITGTMDMDMIHKVMQIYNDSECKNHIVYFTSVGGENRCAHAIVDATKNYMSKGGSITFIFYGMLFSNGFEIMFSLPRECVYYVKDEIVGMTHLSCLSISMLSNGKGSTQDDNARVAHLTGLQDKQAQFLKTIGLTDKEIRSVKKGNDVFFQTDRLVEILDINGIKSTEVLLQTNNTTV